MMKKLTWRISDKLACDRILSKNSLSRLRRRRLGTSEDVTIKYLPTRRRRRRRRQKRRLLRSKCRFNRSSAEDSNSLNVLALAWKKWNEGGSTPSLAVPPPVLGWPATTMLKICWDSLTAKVHSNVVLHTHRNHWVQFLNYLRVVYC